jgi:hypothetical protein
MDVPPVCLPAIVAIDLKRQYAERGETMGEIKAYASEIIALILTALLVAK